MKNNFWQKDIYVKIFALLLAIGLWFYVVNEQSVRIQRTFVIPVEYHGLSSDLAVVENYVQVEVKITGLKESVLDLQKEDIKAYVDLTGAKEGQYYLPVKVNAPVSVKITESKPEKINVRLEAIISKKIAVVPEVRGDSFVKNAVASISSDIKEVTVKGPRSKVQEAVLALAIVHLNATGDNLKIPGKIMPVNSSAQLISGLQINPEFTQIRVSSYPAKQVNIRAVLQGEPAAGYVIKKVLINPAILKVIGPADFLEQIMEIPTEEINLNGIDKTLEKDVFVTQPANLTILGSRRVKIIVLLEKIAAQKNFSQVPVQNKDNPQANVNPQKVDLTVKGPKEIIDKIKQTDLKVTVDDNSVNSEIDYYANPQVEAPQGVIVEKIYPSKVLITRKKNH